MFITFKNENEYEKAKVEFNQIIGFLKANKTLDGFKSIAKITKQLNECKELTLNSFTIHGSHIDNRSIKCGCGKENCKIGLNFDEDIMYLTDKYGNDTAMQLDKSNIDEIISHLKEIKKTINDKI